MQPWCQSARLLRLLPLVAGLLSAGWFRNGFNPYVPNRSVFSPLLGAFSTLFQCQRVSDCSMAVVYLEERGRWLISTPRLQLVEVGLLRIAFFIGTTSRDCAAIRQCSDKVEKYAYPRLLVNLFALRLKYRLFASSSCTFARNMADQARIGRGMFDR